MNVKGKRISVLGLGESGLKTALFLKKRGADVFVSESNTSQRIQERSRILAKENIPHEVGEHSLDMITSAKLVVISPGINPRSAIYQHLLRAQIDVISEIELASRFCPGQIIAVSGTDGKTTVSTLIAKILTACGHHTILCGNIGNPFIGEIDSIHQDTKVVCEVSSFQLYFTRTFHPHVSVLLNIAQDHLDWHENFAEYVDSKLRLFHQQLASDFAILNFADQTIQENTCKIKAKQIYFNQFPSEFDANQQAALAICEVYGCDRAQAEEVVRTFPGVEHRREVVRIIDGITFINDSKATTLNALTWALERSEGSVLLICGGKNKGLDFASVSDIVRGHVKKVFAIGEAQEAICKAWEGTVLCQRCPSLESALQAAYSKATKGESILLSPACASFDMFENYEERGRVFKQLVHSLESKKV